MRSHPRARPATRHPATPAGLLPLLLLVSGLLPPAPREAGAQAALYRVNCGGPELASLDGGPAWARDQNGAEASPYGNAAATGDWIFGSSAAMGPPHASVPAYVPAAVFDYERWDPGTAPEMRWEFPVPPGTYRVNLFVAEGYSGNQFPGARVMDVAFEDAVRVDDLDIFQRYGGYTPAMETAVVPVADGSLSIEFRHGVENTAIRAIEVVPVSASGRLGTSPAALDFGTRLAGTLSPPRVVTVTNLGAPGDPVVQVTGIAVAPGFTHDLSPQALAPGESREVLVRFAPPSAGSFGGSLEIAHDGAGSPTAVALAGEAATSIPVGFGKSGLGGTASVHPTSLQFGPDGRLYVAQRDGRILAYSVARAAPDAYAVTATEEIALVRDLPNHDDDGTPNPGVDGRLVTGLAVAGTVDSVEIYVTSSDPRMNVAGDIGLDTNSGVLSRLTRVAGTWARLDLVRGLPRSENDHATNGLALDAATRTLYVAQGGNANMGAPSLNFSFLPEVALSAAILAVDLDALGEAPYDLPTLDDEDRPGSPDANDPFGGNDGKNQAVIVPGGPVRVHSPGWRNPYDVLLHSNGRMYAVDNGPNAGWGGPPVGAGPGGACSNADNDDDSQSLPDHLHVVPHAGFYAGHPNPTRASVANTFNASNPQSPVPAGNPVECEYRPAGSDSSLARWNASTNGLDEYRASNFGGALQGSILAASFANSVERVGLAAGGDSSTVVETLFSNVGVVPLDLTALGDDGPFPGTVWVADYVTGAIVVFEPDDYDGGGAACTGADDPALDEDGDGFTNADELDNGTSPCSAADVPADHDGDLLSDRNDPDDDNDGALDPDDPFARDAANGAATALPALYTWDGGVPGNGFFGLGFTGLMTNGAADYLDLFDPVNLTPGGAAGKLTVDAVPPGDALAARNDQAYAFQFGMPCDSATAPFSVRTRLSAPFFGGAAADSQSFGLFVGDGRQDDYVRLALHAASGAGGVSVTLEHAGAAAETVIAVPGVLAALGVDLHLDVDPASGTVRPRFAVDGGPLADAGPPRTVPPGGALEAAVRGTAPLAVGIIGTSRGAAPFTATWDFLHVLPQSLVAVPAPAPPAADRLLAAAPHPARGGARLRFVLARPGRARLALYAVDGSRVRTFDAGERPAGEHAVRWDGRDGHGGRVPPGVYFLELRTAERRETRRLIVLE